MLKGCLRHLAMPHITRMVTASSARKISGTIRPSTICREAIIKESDWLSSDERKEANLLVGIEEGDARGARRVLRRLHPTHEVSQQCKQRISNNSWLTKFRMPTHEMESGTGHRMTAAV